jgi:carbohydrate kinase (thermoresistant glucokinase family)
MLLILFGLPGAGKTYVGEILQQEFGFFLYDGDQDIPPKMRALIDAKQPLNDHLRDEFFERLITNIQKLSQQYPHLVVAQTFIKEKYRRQLLKILPNAKFVLVETKTDICEKRLMKRKTFPLDLDYARKMVEIFEKPMIEYEIIENNHEGKAALIQQLSQFSSFIRRS